MTLVIILCWYYASSPFNQKVRLPKPTDGVLNAAERSSHLAIQVDVGHPFTYGGIHGLRRTREWGRRAVPGPRVVLRAGQANCRRNFAVCKVTPSTTQ